MLFAQENEKTKQTLKSAPFIFKGTVISYKAFRKDNDEKLYLLYLIEIDAIYKGAETLKIGTVELLSAAPTGYQLMEDGNILKLDQHRYFATKYDEQEAELPFELMVGSSGVFIGNKIVDEGIQTSNISENNIILTPICETNKCYFSFLERNLYDKETDKVIGKFYVSGFGQKFKTLNDFNLYFEEINLTSQKEVKKKM